MIFHSTDAIAAIKMFNRKVARRVHAMRIVVRINAQPARDGIVIDADDDNGVRPDFLDLARETAMTKVLCVRAGRSSRISTLAVGGKLSVLFSISACGPARLARIHNNTKIDAARNIIRENLRDAGLKNTECTVMLNSLVPPPCQKQIGRQDSHRASCVPAR